MRPMYVMINMTRRAYITGTVLVRIAVAASAQRGGGAGRHRLVTIQYNGHEAWYTASQSSFNHHPLDPCAVNS